MVSSIGFSGNIDRRAGGAQARTYVKLPIVTLPAVKYSELVTECPSREYLVNLLEKQIGVAQQKGYPICLALVNLKTQQDLPVTYADAAFTAVTKIFRSHLRPTDTIVRRDKTIGLIMHDCDDKGGESVCRRLKEAVSRRLFFGKQSVTVEPLFGVSSDLKRSGSAGQSLLCTAEAALEQAKQ